MKSSADLPCWVDILAFSSPKHNVPGVSYCDGPVSVVSHPQFASIDISSVLLGGFQPKLIEVLQQNYVNCSPLLHKMAAELKIYIKKTLQTATLL